MGKTTKTYKGKPYRDRNARSKKTGLKKFFGFTSGAHSRGLFVRDENGNYSRIDRAPVKGKDFIKYGWPLETRHASVIRDRAVTREMDEELKQYNNRNDEN